MAFINLTGAGAVANLAIALDPPAPRPYNRAMQRCFSILLLCAAFALAGQAAEPDVPPLYQSPKWWWPLFGPAEATPGEQLIYADEAADRGKLRKASRHYRRLANFWPEAPEAPAALISLAELYKDKNHLRLAFKTYQDVINRYAGDFDYLDIVKQQVMLASEIQQERVGGFGFLPGFEAPERAIPYYAQIITNAPQWEKVAEVHFTIGAIQEENKDYEEAMASYEQALSRFPDSPWAEPAEYHKALCMTELARERPNDDAAAESAWALLTQYLNNHAGSERSADALQLQAEMRQRLARSYFEKAHYYDEIVKRPKSALIAYQSFLEQFPNSEWTEQAQSRIETLKQQTSP